MLLIELNEISLFMEKRREIGEVEDKESIGTIIKEKRSLKQKTLREITEGICCPAYLSKLERNLSPKANEKVIKGLCEKLELDYQKLVEIENGTLLDYALKDYLYHNTQSLKSSCQGEKVDLLTSKMLLVHGLVSLIEKDYDKFNTIVQRLDIIKKSLSDFELGTLLFIMSKYYIVTAQYNKAYTYIEYSNLLVIRNKYLEILLLENSIIVGCVLNSNKVGSKILKIKKHYDVFYPMSRQFLIRVYNQYTFDPEIAKENLKIIGREVIPIYKNEYDYAVIVNYCRLEKYQKVIDIIYKNHLRNKKYQLKFIALFALSILNVMAINRDEYLKALDEMIISHKYQNDNNFDNTFIRWIKYQIEGADNSIILSYLRNHMIPDCDIYYNPIYNDYAITSFYNLLIKEYKYKEASKFVYKMYRK